MEIYPHYLISDNSKIWLLKNEGREAANDTDKESFLVLSVAAATTVVGVVFLTAVAIVQWLGFGSVGILPGSPAAAMMAVGAIGGVTLQGSTVAILQSVGAVGFSSPLSIAVIVMTSVGVAIALGYGIYLIVQSFSEIPPCSLHEKNTKLPFRKIAIKAPNGKYLRALGGGLGNWFFDFLPYTGKIKAESIWIRNWEIFTIHPCEDERFFLQCHHGTYFSAINGGGSDIEANSHNTEIFGKFQSFVEGEMDLNGSKGYFQTYDGSYVTINHTHAHFTANTTIKGNAALFEIIMIE